MDWILIGSEVLVAAVIYWELESSRVDKFLSDALNEDALGKRVELYSTFCETEGNLDERRRAFKNRIDGDKGELRKNVTIQIATFSRAQTAIPSVQRWKVRDFVPHNSINLWVMAYPLIGEKQDHGGAAPSQNSSRGR